MLLERDNLQNLQTPWTPREWRQRSSQRVVTTRGATAGGHTTPPNAGRQPPKVQDLSVFRTFRDGWWDDPRNWEWHKCRHDETVRPAMVSDRPNHWVHVFGRSILSFGWGYEVRRRRNGVTTGRVPVVTSFFGSRSYQLARQTSCTIRLEFSWSDVTR